MSMYAEKKLRFWWIRLNLQFLVACNQVGIYYEEALAALTASPLKHHFEKGWISHVQMKAALFYSEAFYRYGNGVSRERGDCGIDSSAEERSQPFAPSKEGAPALTRGEH